jgi:dolichol-phosphate mannosyltransferase
MKEKKLVSIVTPVLNEEDNIEELYESVKLIMSGLNDSYRYEHIFTDNHSTDQTFEILKRIASKDKNVRVIRFSRNFGYQNSIYCGYIFSKGDAVIQLDGDLQDPPELIPEFLKKWEEGYKVVYGVRKKREEGMVIQNIRKMFYRILNKISEFPIPLDAGDFRLVDKSIIEEFRKIYDASPYIRGLIPYLGHKHTGIEYERARRKRGKSKFNFPRLIELAVDGIVNYSIVPLRVITLFGILIFIFSITLSMIYLVAKVFFDAEWPRGFATLVVLITFSISLNSIFIGILGEYLSRTYKQVKRLPITVIESIIDSN